MLSAELEKAKILTVWGQPASGEECGEICGVCPDQVETLKGLGVVFDKDLSWEPQFQQSLAKMAQAASNVVGALDSTGFGLPFQAAQFQVRVESVGLFAAEVLASHSDGVRGLSSGSMRLNT